MTILLLLVLLGLGAGTLTTIAGMGGGVLLVLALSLATDPRTALVATAPALLLGNAHRFWLFRREVAWRVARPFLLGALPGSLFGGLLLPHVPVAALAWLMLAMTALGVAKALGAWTWVPKASAIAPASFVVGGLAATSGGAGVLAAPLLMAAGLTGLPYIATGAAGAAAMHLGRIFSYGASGLFDRTLLLYAAVLAITILSGNLAGRWLRKEIGESVSGRIEIASLVACVALAVVGVGHR